MSLTINCTPPRDSFTFSSNSHDQKPFPEVNFFINCTPPRISLEKEEEEVTKADYKKLLNQMFASEYWEEKSKQSCLLTLIKTPIPERVELIHLTLRFQKLDGWFPRNTIAMLKALLSDAQVCRKDTANAAFLLSEKYRNIPDDVIESIQIITKIVELDRPSVLNAITSHITGESPLRTVNIFLDIFRDFSKEQRRYYIENKNLDHTLAFITPSYWKEEIKRVIKIIDKVPSQGRDELISRILPWMKEVEEVRTRTLVFEQLVYLESKEREKKLREEFSFHDWVLC